MVTIKYTVYANAKGKTVDILMKKNQLGYIDAYLGKGQWGRKQIESVCGGRGEGLD